MEDIQSKCLYFKFFWTIHSVFLWLFCMKWTRTGFGCHTRSREGKTKKRCILLEASTYDMNMKKTLGMGFEVITTWIRGFFFLLHSVYILSKWKQHTGLWEGLKLAESRSCPWHATVTEPIERQSNEAGHSSLCKKTHATVTNQSTAHAHNMAH